MGILDKFLDVFKLNDDEAYDDDNFLDDEIDDTEEEQQKPKKRFFKKQEEEDDFESYGYDESIPPAKNKGASQKLSASSSGGSRKRGDSLSGSSNKISPMRTRKSNYNMEVCMIRPTSMEDGKEIADTLLTGRTVVLNMEGLNLETAQRLIDFSSGACTAITGNLVRISKLIFILTPPGVDVSGDFQQDVLKGVYDLPPLGDKF